MDKKYNSVELKRLKNSGGFVHQKFGDLNNDNSIRLLKYKRNGLQFRQYNPYFVHLSITGRCNARCKGCINSSISFKDEQAKFFLSPVADTNPIRDAKGILDIVKDIDGEIEVCFYGGEPLLLTDRLFQIVEYLKSNSNGKIFNFMVYTNGQLLDKALESWEGMADDVWLYSVSIDGRANQHNAIRLGTDLDVIHENLRILSGKRKGEVLVWSTLREQQSLWDCFEEFMFLQNHNLAEHFFWHWIETDKGFEDFDLYLQNYESQFRAIIEVYMKHLKQGELLSIVHLNELILFALCGIDRGGSACGVEYSGNYDIAAGEIMPCSDLGFESKIGYIDADGKAHIENDDLAFFAGYRNELGCDVCGVGSYCGGRCPVEAFNSGALRLVQYCQLMRLHVGIVCEYLNEIYSLYQHAGLSLQDIYDRSGYLAQFTDVTP